MEMVLTCTCIGGMEMLVCGGGSGEGYHVLFCWNYRNYNCCFVNCPCAAENAGCIYLV